MNKLQIVRALLSLCADHANDGEVESVELIEKDLTLMLDNPSDPIWEYWKGLFDS